MLTAMEMPGPSSGFRQISASKEEAPLLHTDHEIKESIGALIGWNQGAKEPSMVTRVARNIPGRVGGPTTGYLEKEKLFLQSEKEETGHHYRMEIESASELLQMPREPDSPSTDLAREDQLRRISALNARLRQIDQALHRIRTGIYGICTGCGIEISRARLEHDLATEYCMVCQAESESVSQRHTL
jgi:RNA polymerase-binding transcription factor DksA